ncbi:uncharacterized protein (DUF302 family) [Sagittula marina]|uniref:Uncharacterized protein (DUF302 family) n=1 Tax=Sagittula marina TaxID=943940 RepID=A0A7W6GTY1_9RHOB|nr:DUF302 domain-containing protein [Sagittula marina]MBB3985699.1 uncharacterized protein (DUF302 family) [Sagittula marina]
MKYLLAATAIMAATVVQADEKLDWVEAEGTVQEAMDRLEAAVEEAGATVFARIDHGQGAKDVDMSLPNSQLLIFGNPKLGTPVMQENFRAGLVLPLRVLAVWDQDKTWFVYQEPHQMLISVNGDSGVEEIDKMHEALKSLTEKAADAN